MIAETYNDNDNAAGVVRSWRFDDQVRSTASDCLRAEGFGKAPRMMPGSLRINLLRSTTDTSAMLLAELVASPQPPR